MTPENDYGIVILPDMGRSINIALIKGDTHELFKVLAEYFHNNNLNISKKHLDEFRNKGLLT